MEKMIRGYARTNTLVAKAVANGWLPDLIQEALMAEMEGRNPKHAVAHFCQGILYTRSRKAVWHESNVRSLEIEEEQFLGIMQEEYYNLGKARFTTKHCPEGMRLNTFATYAQRCFQRTKSEVAATNRWHKSD